MQRFVIIGLIVLAILTAAGLILPAIQRARQEEEMRRCQNHLRQIGAFAILHSTVPGQPLPAKAQTFFPSATVLNTDLLVDQRLSWYILALSALEQGQTPEPGKQAAPRRHTVFNELMKDIDVKQAWHADVHRKLARTHLPQAQCPAQAHATPSDQPALCNYLGNGGIGLDAPTLPLDKSGVHAGAFRYDAITPLDAIVNGDGSSNSIAFVETATNLGPWIQGGVATIRCLDPDRPPYLGAGRLYSGCHTRKGNFAFADGSVRVFTDSTNADFFRALLTIQGGESLIEQ